MTQANLEAYLGRSLSALEVTNLTLYLELSQERLEDLLCINLTTATEDRTFGVRNGYQTVFTDLYTKVNSVTVGGNVITDYETRQWDRRNASWYNSIILDTYENEVTINADWGCPSKELQQLQARLFSLISTSNVSGGNVKRKSVEDFTIEFSETPVYNQFLTDNRALIDKFSLCSIGNIQHGNLVWRWTR